MGNGILRRPTVWAKLPQAGLANMLFVWARALAFARINDGELFVSSWTNFRLGPFVRGDRSKRLYLGTFNRAPLRSKLRLLVLRVTRTTIYDPPLATVSENSANARLYVFDGLVGDPKDPFRDLMPYRTAIASGFSELLSNRVRAGIDALAKPVIGLHVRRGDFKGTDWLTPIEHFCERLRSIRAVAGRMLPAIVFSDGSDEELAPLLAMPAVRRAPRQSDVLDLIQLSKSQVIVPSRGSTFSMLAGFLSEAVIIRDPEWNHGDSRPPEINARHFEGGPAMDSAYWPDLLVQNLMELRTL